jgi:ABC-type glycerol-3-phosphate transport system substrate-binding protein
MTMKRVVIALLLGAAGLAACGDGKVEADGETIGYRYQGKPDIHAWDSPEAGGAKAERERQIEARTLNQNEYTRTR